ncbi:hypothetical protein FJ250_10370, partial [bacterium]|nr:hypothetical protein [bacterium]
MRRWNLSRLVGMLAIAGAAASLPGLEGSAIAADIHVPATERTISAALSRANPGDRVLVAPGTYYEHGLKLPAGVVLAGAGAAPGAVVINAQAAGRILSCENYTRFAEIRNLSFVGGFAAGATLADGSGGALLISNAAVNVIDCEFRGNYSARNGGAVWVFEASPTFSGCLFASNAAGGGGGGMDCTLFASPSLQNCRFEDNRADWGAGLSCRDSSSPVLLATVFAGNRTEGARGYGGGAFCDLDSKPLFFGCTFTRNDARYGGGIANFAESGVTLVRCTLVENRGFWRGAGIYTSNAVTSVNASIVAFHEGSGIHSGGTYGPQVYQSNLFGNTGGDWIGAAAPSAPGPTNRASDPRFCANTQPGATAFNLQETSPCHPDSNGGLTLGAWPVGCGAPLPTTLVLNAGWHGAQAHLQWRLPDGLGVTPQFRLTGARAATPELTWDVPFSRDGEGLYTADDPAATLQGSGPYLFRLYAAFTGAEWTLMAQAMLELEPDSEVPVLSRVLAAPNPFNPATTISFELDRAQRVRVFVYDLDGTPVARLADAQFEAGTGRVTWTGVTDDGRSLASGTYLVLIDTPSR